MKKINPKYLHPLVRPNRRRNSAKEMKYMNTHYSKVIPAPTPHYAKMSPSPTSPPPYYRYEVPDYSIKENESLPTPDRRSHPVP